MVIMTSYILSIIFIIPCFIGLIILQIYLSKKPSKLPGLIIPIILFILSLLITLGISVYSVTPKVKVTAIDESGQIIDSKSYDNAAADESKNGQAAEHNSFVAPRIGTVVTVFLIFNIPTLISLAIYFGCRRKFHRKKQLEKMNIQDLE